MCVCGHRCGRACMRRSWGRLTLRTPPPASAGSRTHPPSATTSSPRCRSCRKSSVVGRWTLPSAQSLGTATSRTPTGGRTRTTLAARRRLCTRTPTQASRCTGRMSRGSSWRCTTRAPWGPRERRPQCAPGRSTTAARNASTRGIWLAETPRPRCNGGARRRSTLSAKPGRSRSCTTTSGTGARPTGATAGGGCSASCSCGLRAPSRQCRRRPWLLLVLRGRSPGTFGVGFSETRRRCCRRRPSVPIPP
mmetsp:Transcript_49812/g.140171  ORF Transcript_49812/g.140171 Transcript_49812/m.140171 type:complete len:249 (+) Transcript_49812:167-913(+)